MLTLRADLPTPLVVQIVDGLRGLIAAHVLKPGSKLPSIRAFAAAHGVSVFTVVEAYDRLVAQGWLVSRANAGFFVKRRGDEGTPAGTSERPAPRFDARWYLKQIFENRNLPMKPGYGLPHGHLPLRSVVVETLAEHHVGVAADQVLLAHGSSQALDLVARRLVKPGDTVLVADPGYPNLMFMLRFLGAQVVGVPRTPAGYDLQALETLLGAHRPSAFFTQPRLQSPTCSQATVAHLHRLLQLAEQHGFMLVENDIYADMDTGVRPSLASLDQLNRVVYVGSYSKTISPNLRTGFVAARPGLLDELVQLKMLSGLTSSEITERITLGVVTDGRWRKHLKGLRERLAEAHRSVGRRLEGLGFELFHEPEAGMYLWARHPDLPDSAELSRAATGAGIMLGPGELFLVEPRSTGWLRFNVAFSLDERLWQFLEERVALHAHSAQ